MNDSIFDGCVFKNVELRETEMIGCLLSTANFKTCVLRRLPLMQTPHKRRENTTNRQNFTAADFQTPQWKIACVPDVQ